MKPIPSSQITPESVYLNRRQILRGMGLGAGSLLVGACAAPSTGGSSSGDRSPDVAPLVEPDSVLSVTEAPPVASAATDELGQPLTSFEAVTNYNNFYEFTTSKEGVARLAEDFVATPWTVEVGGLVNNPQTFDVDGIKALADVEERIYRLRCVEAWSMVVPWSGIPLAALLKTVQPKAEAKFVRFETLSDPDRLPGQKSRAFTWPYAEGLRLDEAMHDLAILATGLYGRDLPAQNGAPIRLVVPWKYGFKSIKSIVRIDLVDEMPSTLWNDQAPSEYGFFANVNPEVDHPRWSQKSERRIEGGLRRIDTLPFNGYGDQVAQLYAGMDLTKWF